MLGTFDKFSDSTKSQSCWTHFKMQCSATLTKMRWHINSSEHNPIMVSGIIGAVCLSGEGIPQTQDDVISCFYLATGSLSQVMMRGRWANHAMRIGFAHSYTLWFDNSGALRLIFLG